jgi:hypothetical protein
MSAPWTGRAQRARLDRLGLHTAVAPELRDVDTAADAWAVADLVPHSRFTAALRRIATSRRSSGGLA